MKYRALGRTDIRVSEIGFGTWGIGGSVNGAIGYGTTDDEESKTALRRALELGVNFYDTADIYGFGHSEELLGEVFHRNRQDVVINSKAGFLNFENDQDFSLEHIRGAAEASLNRLRTDYIDVFHLHNPEIGMLRDNPDILGTLNCLKEEGKCRATGISVRSPDDGIAAVKQFDFDVIEVNLNLVDQRALENGLLDICREKNIGVIIRTPLCYGFLTGAYTVDSLLDPHDQRRKWSHKQIERWAGSYRLFIDKLASSEKSTGAQLALRFCLSCPGVSTVIPGMLNVQHVEENLASSDMGALGQEDFQKVLSTYRDNEFFINET